jgi:uncharacterized protein
MAGQMVHLEIPTGDTAKAREFWGGLFGWEFQPMEGSPTEYHMTRFSETTGGAVMESDGTTKGPRVYFDTDDINASVARVTELGGKSDSGAQAVPGMGWFATCEDSVGNQFGLWQNDPNAGAS